MIRIWVGVLVGLFLFTLQDILLWAVIFEADELWQYIGIYHRGWFVMLYALAIAGFVWTWPNWKKGLLHAGILLSLAFCGLEDMLYYVLQGKPLPGALPWLDAHPLIFFKPVTSSNLQVNILGWLAAWLLVSVVLGIGGRRQPSTNHPD